jgi:hypothetical protein
MVRMSKNFEYQAYGILELKVFHDGERDKYFGVLQPEEQDNETIINLDLPNWVKNQLDSKINFSEYVNTNQPIKCGLYPRTNKKLELNFSIIKNVYLGEIEPERKQFTLKGEIVYVNFELEVASIQIKPKSSKLKPFSISFIYSETLTRLKCGQFWEIKAVLEKGKLKAQSGKLLIDKAKSNQLVKSETQHPVKLKGKVAEELENKCTIKNVENNKHNFPIAKRSGTEAKSEVTIKFSGALPQSQPAPNKKVEVQVTDQNGIVFTALINAKSWRKAEANTAEFADWAGAISGKLGTTEKGFEIIDGGVQIFEKKPKEVKQEVASVEASSTSPL